LFDRQSLYTLIPWVSASFLLLFFLHFYATTGLTHQHLEIKDVFIASIAIYNEVWLRTFNEKHFKGIEELKMWQWQ